MSEGGQFDDLERLTVGTIGEPGHRLFLLQFSNSNETLTVKVEKQQVAVLCTYLGDLLADLPAPGHLPEDLELHAPYEFDWIAGSITVTYDETMDRLVFEIVEVAGTDEIDSDDDPVASTRAFVTREQAAALAIHGTSLVESGRPPCPLCGYPLDPTGHACPRTNGHRPPQL